jgi:predicted MFS family arabinose efflux permease
LKDRFIKYYPWIIVAALLVVAMLNYLDRLLIASMRDPIKETIAMTDAQFGLLTSVFLWVYAVLSPFGGYFADRYSRKAVIIMSLLVWSGVTVWTGFVSSFGEMLAARAVMGISEACYIPAALALVTDYHKGGTRSLATGLHISGLYLGAALGGLGGFIADTWGWRYAFHLFGFFGIAYSVLLFFLLKDLSKESQRNAELALDNNSGDLNRINLTDSVRNIFSSGSYLILLVYNGILGMSFWLIYAWLPTFLKEQFHLSLAKAGISATLYLQVASFGGVLIGGILADRWSRVNLKGRLFMPVIGFTVGAPFLFLMASTGVFGIAIASLIFFGLARGIHDSNLMPIMCQVVDKHYRATGYGILNFVSTIIGGIMIYVGGALKDANINLSLVYKISAVGLLIATWVLLLVKPKTES